MKYMTFCQTWCSIILGKELCGVSRAKLCSETWQMWRIKKKNGECRNKKYECTSKMTVVTVVKILHFNTLQCNILNQKVAFSISLLKMPVWVAFKSEQDPTPTKHLCVFPCCEILWPMQAVLEWCTICQRWSWSNAKCSFNDPAPYILSPVDILLYLGCMKLHSF